MVRTVLQRGLDESLDPPGAIETITRRPSAYRTSFPIEEVTVVLDDGRRLDLILKDVNRSSLAPDARAAKPSSVYDPRREIEVYRSIVGGADVGTARCHATVADERAGHYWLCMESVPGRVLRWLRELDLT